MVLVWYGTGMVLVWCKVVLGGTGMVCYNHLLCHTPLLHATIRYLPTTRSYTLPISCIMLCVTSCVTCVFNVRASSWTAKAAHSRKAEAPSYRGCPSPLRSFGAAPLTTTKLKMQAKLRDRCSDLLAGQTTIKLRRTTLTCLIIIVFDRIAIFAESVRV